MQNNFLNQQKPKNPIISPIAKESKKVLGLVSTITPTSTPLPTATTVQKKIRLGVVVNDYANKTGELSSLQEQLGIHFSTVSIFKQFGLPTNNMLNVDDLSYIKSQNSKLLVAWEPWNPQEGLHQSKDYLKEIIEGKQDEYIKNFAKAVRSYGAPVTIRFGHEMNGDWYPWGKRPQEYIAAYRRVVTLFKNEGIENVSWMWSINATPLANITSFYPGDDVVDSIGFDGFNFGTTQPTSTWVSFSQIFSPVYNLVVKTYNKPLIISETASAEQGGDKAVWIRNMTVEVPRNMPRINEIVWFSLLKETDWRLNSTPSTLTTFKQLF